MDFSQYSGFLLFMVIFTAGYWLLIFALTVIVPYWLTAAWIDLYKERKERKSSKKVDNNEGEIAEESIL